MIARLLAINLKGMFAGMFRTARRKGRSGKGMKVLFAALFVYAFGACMLGLGVILRGFCTPLFEAGIGWLYFALISMMMLAICVITSIFTVQSLVFGAKDNELLLSMPVKPSAIVVSRILTLLVYEYIFALIVAAPALVVWLSSGYATASGVVIFIVELLFFPLLALAVACVLGWLLSLLTSRLRNKNIVTVAVSLAFLAAYFFVVTNMQTYMARLIENGAAIAEAIRKAAFPMYHFGVAAADSSVTSLLLVALCSIVPFAVMCAVLAKGFVRIATTKHGAARVKYTARELRTSGVRAALVRKECSRFFSNPMIVMNAGIGAIFLLAIAAVVLVRPSLLDGIFVTLEAIAPGVSINALAAPLLMAMCSFLTISSSLISLEGKTLWLVKSLPVSGGDILFSKAAAHAVISGVPALAAALACIIRFGGSVFEIIAMIAAPIAMSIAMGYFGVIVNLMFPKLDWTSEIQPVKQGISVLICMFGSLAVVICLALLYAFVLRSVVDITTYTLLCAALMLVLAALMHGYAGRGGARRLLELNN